MEDHGSNKQIKKNSDESSSNFMVKSLEDDLTKLTKEIETFQIIYSEFPEEAKTSILNKANVNDFEIKHIYSDTEKDIYIKVLELSRILDKAYSEKTLSYICEFLFELCSLFNKFYSECSVLNEKDYDRKSTYIALLNLLYNTCINLLDILAIKVPNKM